ncbi:MAG: SurA N-terminal domain-containing protein [Fibromonadales bacterium]|nr:SurA N-terminal domain-containing protein [Fibromonadales bacterium]
MKIVSLVLLIAFSAYAQLLSGGNFDVIKVNGVGISQGKVDSVTNTLKQFAQAQGQNVSSAEYTSQLRWVAINQLVGQELVKAEIAKQGLKASAKKVDSLAAALKSQFPSDAAFKQELKKTNSTEADFRKYVETQLLAEQLLEKNIPMPQNPTDKEKKDYWEKHKSEAVVSDTIGGVRIVLNIAKGESSQEIQDKKDILKGLAAQARSAKVSLMVLMEQFAMMAARTSEDPSAKKDGGIMKKFLPKSQGNEFANAVKNLKVGDISDPFVQDGNKVIIFMMTEKNDGKYESYEHEIDYILRLEAERQRQLSTKDYLDKLAKTYKVQYLNKDYTPPEAIGQ